MNSAAEVTKRIAEWKTQGLTKSAFSVKIAEACMGWPYVWGGYGQFDTPANRRSYANRSSCPEGESKVIVSKCQVLKGTKSTCAGCRYYPHGASTRFFDCRGFTRWVLQQVGIRIEGGGATSQWNASANWKAKGEIGDGIPETVCCVFMRNGKKMSHTGLYVGNGRIIHCSGEVKEGRITDRGWSHWAVPVGMEGDVPVPTTKPTVRRGSAGAYVKELQEDLIKLGYDVGKTGADGKFGANTELAVKRFQANHQLTADGVCGPATWEAIEKAIDPQPVTVLWTVHIPHLTEYQADALRMNYVGSWKTAEGSDA